MSFLLHHDLLLVHSFGRQTASFRLSLWQHQKIDNELSCRRESARLTSLALSYGAKKHFDVLKRLGVDYERDRQTDRQTVGQTDRLKPYSAHTPILTKSRP